MKERPKIILALCIGIAIGAWFGLNHMRGQPLYAFPFAPPSASEVLADGLLQAYREAVDDNASEH